MKLKFMRSFLFISLFFTQTISDPVCSKFPYEEQLLEKMIRVEFNVGQMEKEIKDTNSLVLESLRQLNQTWEKVVEEFETLKLEVKNVLDEKEEKVSNEIEGIRAEMVRTLEEYSDTISEYKASVSVPNIAFKARSPSSSDPGDNKVIVFTKNIVNFGDAYDNTTGIFTAPIDGTYLFTSQLCLNAGTWITFGIFIDDILYTVGRFYDVICFNIETTSVMKANQRASVKGWSASAKNVLYEDDIHRWNLFSGTLIHI